MKTKEILTGDEIREIKEMARDARKQVAMVRGLTLLLNQSNMYGSRYPIGMNMQMFMYT